MASGWRNRLKPKPKVTALLHLDTIQGRRRNGKLRREALEIIDFRTLRLACLPACMRGEGSEGGGDWDLVWVGSFQH